MFEQTFRYRQQQLLPGGSAMLECPRVSDKWHATKANLGIRWRT
jgi:hypothetical protein